MNRRKFIGFTSSAVIIAGITYVLGDTTSIVRDDLRPIQPNGFLKADERKILYLASLAPSSHNTQPWFIQRLEPMHWIICNDSSRWLPVVDPLQRETILSIGAFIQNLQFAAESLGYVCLFTLLASKNQDKNVMKVILIRSGKPFSYDITRITHRRTVRSKLLTEKLSREDLKFFTHNENDFINFIPRSDRICQYINEQTIEANRIQSNRNLTQKELADWMRLSNKDAVQHRDGLSTASMEIEGLSGWVVRNFYNESDVMSKSFRDQTIKKTVETPTAEKKVNSYLAELGLNNIM